MNFVIVFRDHTLSDPNLIRFSLQFVEGYRAPTGAAMHNGDIPPKKTDGTGSFAADGALVG